ncbi:MAG TPA: VanW family protein [Candidatus Saccharimonadales bacterium]|nr:VanW family protein [Candidatus Saccharimonadales bacterium]
MKFYKPRAKHAKKFTKTAFWFCVGASLGLFLFTSFVFIIFQNIYKNVVYPGVAINGVNFGGKTQKEVRSFFQMKNSLIKDTTFTLTSDKGVATVSATQLNLGFNDKLLSEQAYSIGRSPDVISNVSLILQAYINGVNLPLSFHVSTDALRTTLADLKSAIDVTPVDAQFELSNGRVTTFHPSSDGQQIDFDTLNAQLNAKALPILLSSRPQAITLAIPIKTLKPKITTDKVNSLGIKELIGTGTSLFGHSIESRIYNVTLAASRVNGVIVAPGEVFSFDKALGDVSAFTGYKSAYVIENGKTVLGDGGGVCQVSTTLFRALLNAGLPIVERHAHAYRVGYYEEDSPPGLDATVYVPTVDLKFKNDTGHSILIQSIIDPSELRLTFLLYGTKDGRVTTLTTPVVTNETPAPPDKFEDDPTLPKGQIKQVDFAAAGATVTFSRKVVKDNKTIIAETYTSVYQPWQAVFMRGTQ